MSSTARRLLAASLCAANFLRLGLITSDSGDSTLDTSQIRCLNHLK
jgi:hypothetical protein